MRPKSRIQTTGPNNGHQLRDYSKSSNRSENRPLIFLAIKVALVRLLQKKMEINLLMRMLQEKAARYEWDLTESL